MPHTNIITDDDDIADILRSVRRIAVLGIKPESRRGQPAHRVPEYMQSAGYEVVPVPVYYPDVSEILGRPVYRRLADLPEPVDMVNVFRRPKDVPAHLDDLLAAEPAVVWMQSGIRHDETAQVLAEGGIRVVQDRCLMVEHGRLLGR